MFVRVKIENTGAPRATIATSNCTIDSKSSTQTTAWNSICAADFKSAYPCRMLTKVFVILAEVKSLVRVEGCGTIAINDWNKKSARGFRFYLRRISRLVITDSAVKLAVNCKATAIDCASNWFDSALTATRPNSDCAANIKVS